MATEEVSPKTRREHEEDHTPLWIKIFGGSILSITFICVITFTGYIVNNLNSIQIQINAINADLITKREFSERTKSILDTIKIDSDNLVSLKERINALEQLSKERQIWMDKSELKSSEQGKTLENANKEIASQKERANGLESQINLLRDELKQAQKDFQTLREKVAALEAKK